MPPGAPAASPARCPQRFWRVAWIEARPHRTIGGTAAATLLRASSPRSSRSPRCLSSKEPSSRSGCHHCTVHRGRGRCETRTTAFSLSSPPCSPPASSQRDRWHLPALLHASKHADLAAALIGVAILPVLRMRPCRRSLPRRRAIYPRGRFLLRFLAPFAVVALATGAFNPFNKRLFRAPEILCTRDRRDLLDIAGAAGRSGPARALIIRRFGLVNGIVWMMMATAAGLGTLPRSLRRSWPRSRTPGTWHSSG